MYFTGRKIIWKHFDLWRFVQNFDWYKTFAYVDGFIKDCDGTKYLVLYGHKIYDAIFDRVRYLTTLKSEIIYVDSHKCVKLKIDSDDDDDIHNIVILIQSVFNKNNSQYFFERFLIKCLCQLAKN